MNFKNFIIKEADLHPIEISPPKTLDSLKALLNKNCKPFMNTMADFWSRLPLYRGIKTDGKPEMLKFFSRMLRAPRDMPPSLHKFFNEEFFRLRGVSGIRDRGIFVTGHLEDAKNYGSSWKYNVYRIFPIGEFTYWWSPDVIDLWWTMEDLVAAYFDGLPLYQLRPEMLEGNNLDSKRFLDAAEKLINSYTDKFLLRGIDKHTEVIILCDSYYAIQNNYILGLK